jgi:hypothetical protein
MAEEKYSIEQIRDIIENEGIGYAVQYYLGADKIEDGQLSKYWADAKAILDKIETYTEE